MNTEQSTLYKQVIANATGTKDFVGNELAVRQKIISIVKSCFETMDAIEMETPVIELRGIVDQLYGEEFNKFVYEIQDESIKQAISILYENYSDLDAKKFHEAMELIKNGTERKEILRYDLTVPLARYCAMNGIKALRRYQIGKVHRKDNPNVTAGRYREFYQCDFDIVGDDMGSGINDIEVLELMVRILDRLIGRGKYKIKLNHRKLVTDILLAIGVVNDKQKIATVCSTIDKSDKISREEIVQELVTKNNELSLFVNIDNFMKQFCELFYFNGTDFNQLLKYTDQKTIESLTQLLERLTTMGIRDAFEFDLKMVRGLDYYTAIIYEAIYLDKEIMPSSIAAGGRYDNMIGKLSNQSDIPAIGLSIGIERIAKIIEKTDPSFCSPKKPKIYIASIGKSDKVVMERIKLCSEFRNYGIMTVMSNKTNPKMASNFETVFEKQIEYMVIIGEKEIDEGQIKIKDVAQKTETVFNRDDGIRFLIEKIKVFN